MSLEITPLLTIATNGLIGGVVDSAATDPLTIDAGVTLDGGVVAPVLGVLSNVLSGVVGDGVRATASDATVTNLGTVKGAAAAGLGIDLLNGGSVTNAANAAVSGAIAGIGVVGTAAGSTSTVANTGSVSATGQNGVGVILDTGALTNGGTIAAANVGGIGVTIGTGTAGTSLGSSITGALDGLDATGSTIVTNAGAITGLAGTGVSLAAGQLTNAATGTIAGGIDGVALLGGDLVNATGGTITGVLDGISNVGTGTIDNAGAISATAGNGVSTAAGPLTNEAAGTITGATNGVLGTAGSGPGQVTNLGTITATGNGGIGVNLLDGGVVVDSGTIGGTTAAGTPGGVAVNLGGAGGSRLVLDPGAILNGVAQAAGVGNTLEIAAGTGATTLKDIGTTITGFGTTLLDTGAVADVLGAVTTPGTLKVGDGASLTLGGPVAAGVTVDLGGAGAKLTLGDPADFSGTIANLGPDDVLDLGALGTGATVAYDPNKGALTVSVGGVVSDLIPVQLAASLDPLNLGLTLGTDGSGGTTVTVGTGAGGTGGTGTGGTGAGGTGGTGTGAGGTGGTGTGTTGGTGTGGSGTGTTGGTGNGGSGNGTGGGTGTGATTVGGHDGGSTTVTPGSGSGGTTVTTTSPSGATTSFTLPPGSTVAQGTGLAAGDVVSIDPHANFAGHGAFVVSGHVASTSGIKSVTISANVDYKSPTVLGTATVAADGSYTFLDKVGRHIQGFITATATDGLGASTSVLSPYSLQAGIRSPNHVAQEVNYTPDGVATAITNYTAGGAGTVTIRASDQTFQSEFHDTFNNHAAPNNTFVFNPGYGADTINLFRAVGTDHDTISLPSADFANLADVIAHTQNTRGGAVITDPTTGDTIKLTGISKAELKANPSDFSFHA